MMNYKSLFSLFLIYWTSTLNAQFEFTIEEMPVLPESVSNNAVCEGFHNGIPYVYTFGGIDSTLNQAGIHQKSWCFSTQTMLWDTLADLPDTKAKIAAAASRINNIIYIIGGYYVAPNGTETSSSKVHRFSTISHTFLSDGADLPLAIDDHVQGVWRDSLIYVVTGWLNTTNVPNVQIYDAINDNWLTGTSVPNNNLYKAFGASGVIIEDTIFYFGGAAIGANFPATFQRRKGIIDANDPTQITWSIDTLSSSLLSYRSAVTSINDTLFCFGGSSTTYNYDAIAYNGSGIVEPNNRILQVAGSSWDTVTYTLPMDLRGVAKTASNEVYLLGGIEAGGVQSKKLLKLTWRKAVNVALQEISDFGVEIYPNPTQNYLNIRTAETLNFSLITIDGRVLFEKIIDSDYRINMKHYAKGNYFLYMNKEGLEKSIPIIKE